MVLVLPLDGSSRGILNSSTWKEVWCTW